MVVFLFFFKFITWTFLGPVSRELSSPFLRLPTSPTPPPRHFSGTLDPELIPKRVKTPSRKNRVTLTRSCPAFLLPSLPTTWGKTSRMPRTQAVPLIQLWAPCFAQSLFSKDANGAGTGGPSRISPTVCWNHLPDESLHLCIVPRPTTWALSSPGQRSQLILVLAWFWAPWRSQLPAWGGGVGFHCLTERPRFPLQVAAFLPCPLPESPHLHKWRKLLDWSTEQKDFLFQQILIKWPTCARYYILDAGHSSMNQTDKNPSLLELPFWWEERQTIDTINKEIV